MRRAKPRPISSAAILRVRDELSITVALIGEAGSGVMRRDAARVGDEIFVTGTLGDAALGWRILAGKLKAKKNRAATKYLVERFLSPHARLYAGQRLRCCGPRPPRSTSATDSCRTSGISSKRSGVGAEIDASRIPVSPAYRALMGDDLQHALTGGEDYELIFSCEPGHSESELSRRLRRGGACESAGSFGASG